MKAQPWDKGGRRQGVESRQFTYAGHLPERRSGEERRSGFDRRKGPRLGRGHRKRP